MAEKILKSIKFPGLDDVYKIPSGGVSSWEDLADKPELFSGSWNDLSDKPFSELESKTYVYDANLEYEERLDPPPIGAFGAVKVSNDVPNPSDWVGAKFYFGDELVQEITIEDILYEDCENCYAVAQHFIVATSDDAYYEYAPITTGVWIWNRYGTPHISASLPSHTKTIDEKYIPHTIARVSDIPEVFSGSWNDLSDKPVTEFAKDLIGIEWNGNTDGIDTYVLGEDDAIYYYVSSRILPPQQVLQGSLGYHEGINQVHFRVSLVDSKCYYGLTEVTGYLYAIPEPMTWGNMYFPKAGVYFAKYPNGDHLMLLQLAKATVFEESHIPANIARKNDVDIAISNKADVAHTHSWNELEDKPFGEGTPIEITWDGDISDGDTYVTCFGGEGILYHISNLAPSNEQLKSFSIEYWVYNEGFHTISTIEDDTVFVEDYAFFDGGPYFSIVVTRHDNVTLKIMEEDVTLPIAGTYVAWSPRYLSVDPSENTPFSYVSKLTIPASIQTLDEKFIPDTIARVSDIPKPPVTSVNGMTGDVIIEIPEGSGGSWNDLTDRPFYEKENGEVVQLDEKFIPDSIVRTETQDVYNQYITQLKIDIDLLGGLVGAETLAKAIEKAVQDLDLEEYAKDTDVQEVIDQHNKDKQALESALENKADRSEVILAPETGSVGQALVVKSVDANGQPVEWTYANAGGQGVAQIQSDWKQTDETAVDFIKNKPSKNDALDLVSEMGFVVPVADAQDNLFVDADGNVYSLV